MEGKTQRASSSGLLFDRPAFPRYSIGGWWMRESEQRAAIQRHGLKRVVFNKNVGLTFHPMGVKKKTFKALSNFRAGIEGNISELKRVYDTAKANWKGLEGFKAFVWSSVLGYNLVRMARLKLG